MLDDAASCADGDWHFARFGGSNSVMQKTAGAILKTVSVTLALAASMGAAFARPGVVTREAFACTSWAAAYAYTLASLTKQGAKANKNCPIRLSAGTKVEIIATDENGDGYVEVSVNGRNWWIDDERVK
jgi:hypothetical protein